MVMQDNRLANIMNKLLELLGVLFGASVSESKVDEIENIEVKPIEYNRSLYVNERPNTIIKFYDTKIRPDFWMSELMNSSSNNQLWICDWNRFNILMDALQHIRDLYGRVIITSFYRSPEFNDSLPGASKSSFHKKGIAADFRINFEGLNKDILVELFISLGIKNMGFYWKTINGVNVLDRCHIDTGETWNGEEYYIFDKNV